MSEVVQFVPRRRPSQSTGLIHVLPLDDGSLEVIHESASGESFACLGRFPADDRDTAVRFALDSLPTYSPARLGRVACQ
jgi:hypothetical protein